MGDKSKSSSSHQKATNLNALNALQLDHALTPVELADINANISAVFSQQDVDEKELMALVEQRSRIVERQLDTLSGEALTRFAQLESPINDDLLAVVSDLKADLKQQLSKVSKASKAIKKYRQA